ncbi:hypothetical protein U1Q18_017514 [Sarracenia purpurea var. burkii]
MKYGWRSTPVGLLAASGEAPIAIKKSRNQGRGSTTKEDEGTNDYREAFEGHAYLELVESEITPTTDLIQKDPWVGSEIWMEKHSRWLVGC